MGDENVLSSGDVLVDGGIMGGADVLVGVDV